MNFSLVFVIIDHDFVTLQLVFSDMDHNLKPSVKIYAKINKHLENIFQSLPK